MTKKLTREQEKAIFAKKDQGKEYKRSYDELERETIYKGDNVTVNTGRFKNAKGTVTGMGIAGNDYKIKMQTGETILAFPADVKKQKTKFKTTEITQEKWNEKKRHGYTSIASGKWGIPKGTKLILDRDAQGTVLVPVHIKKSSSKKQKYVLYGTSNGMKKKFGTYDSKEEAETAEGIHQIELENSGYEEDVKWSIKKK